jgi:hypothetical protein
MPYTAVTRSALRTLLQNHYDASPFWSATEANDAINEVLRQFNLYTGYWRGSATVVTAANDRFLTVANTLTRATRVTRPGKVLTRKSIVEFYRQRTNWRTQTTATGGDVPTTVQEWAPIGLSGFAIWPAHAAGGLTLTVEAVKITPVLTADGQFVDVGQEELDILLDEMIWVLTFKRPSEQEKQKGRHQKFLQGCVDRNDQLRQSSYFRHALGLDQEQRLLPTRASKDPEEAA